MPVRSCSPATGAWWVYGDVRDKFVTKIDTRLSVDERRTIRERCDRITA